MQYSFVGLAGLQVSRLGLGTVNFGMVTDEATSCEIMNEVSASIESAH
jgi:aryl-alcohol dehydrogenase-like predicted oxidoreductase